MSTRPENQPAETEQLYPLDDVESLQYAGLALDGAARCARNALSELTAAQVKLADIMRRAHSSDEEVAAEDEISYWYLQRQQIFEHQHSIVDAGDGASLHALYLIAKYAEIEKAALEVEADHDPQSL